MRFFVVIEMSMSDPRVTSGFAAFMARVNFGFSEVDCPLCALAKTTRTNGANASIFMIFIIVPPHSRPPVRIGRRPAAECPAPEAAGASGAGFSRFSGLFIGIWRGLWSHNRNRDGVGIDPIRLRIIQHIGRSLPDPNRVLARSSQRINVADPGACFHAFSRLKISRSCAPWSPGRTNVVVNGFCKLRSLLISNIVIKSVRHVSVIPKLHTDHFIRYVRCFHPNIDVRTRYNLRIIRSDANRELRFFWSRLCSKRSSRQSRRQKREYQSSHHCSSS